MRFIDSHTHTYFRSFEDLKQMSSAGVEGLVVCSYFPVRPTGPSTLIDLYRWVIEGELARLNSCGIVGKAAVGIHPRSIPASDVDAVLSHVENLFETGQASVLGEVGLEVANELEVEVLARQIRLAMEHDVAIVLHTPRKNKEEVFEKLVKIILKERVDPCRVIFDHLTPQLIPRVKKIGAKAGITVQPGKLSEGDAVEIVNIFGSEDILINSDLGNVPSDPLTLSRVARAMGEAGISEKDVERAVYLNAKSLLSF
jgi:predicted metal-dependent TIM-barrel fold hydrolase